MGADTTAFGIWRTVACSDECLLGVDGAGGNGGSSPFEVRDVVKEEPEEPDPDDRRVVTIS